MRVDKIHFVCSSLEYSKKVCRELISLYGQSPLKNANVIVALGGDGFMLSILKKNIAGIPVYGMNTGHVGFLMNPLRKKNLRTILSQAIHTHCHPLKAEGEKQDGKPFSLQAFNDVWIERMTPQAAHLKMHVSDGFSQETRGDGILVSTPLGSTGYYATAGGLPFYFDSKCLGLTSICTNPAFKRILPEDVSFSFESLETSKRPVCAVADSVQISSVRTLNVALDRQHPRIILADKKSPIGTRLLSTAFEHVKN